MIQKKKRVLRPYARTHEPEYSWNQKMVYANRKNDIQEESWWYDEK